jgi:AraC-like DNA-binding protein
VDTADSDSTLLLEIRESLVSPPASPAGTLAPRDPKSALVERYEAYRAPLRFHVANSLNQCDSYAVSPSMVMTVVDVGCTAPFECRLCGQDIVEFHYRMSGSLILAGSWGEVRVREPSCLLWYQPNGCDGTAERLGVPNEVRETWVSLYCDRAWLYRAGGWPAAALLDGLTGDGAVSCAPQFRMSAIGEMMPVLKDILRMAQHGELDWLMATAKAHELLHVTLRNAQLRHADEPRTLTMTDSDRRRIANARAILASEFITPPGLRALARRVGVNSSRLCGGFKVLFGETTSTFVRRQRLELAHKLLTTSDFQVREVARRIGYRHHCTFTAAFTRHFGIAPKLARLSSRSRDSSKLIS